MLVRLERLAYARSGDKGDDSNVGLIARSPEIYEFLRTTVTDEWVAARLGRIARGGVRRFEVPNVLALNFILRDSLGGGGTASLLTDAQGKTHAQALLRCEIEVPEASLRAAGL
ncbi:MAG: hypothetical protein HRF46_05425 [Acidobacteriota bacterium]|jgi:hypothetical protein